MVVAQFVTTTHKENYIPKMEIIYLDTEKLTNKQLVDIRKLSTDEMDAEIKKGYLTYVAAVGDSADSMTEN